MRVIGVLEKAVVSAPNAAIMRYHLRMAYAAQGNDAQVKDDLTRVIEVKAKSRGLDDGKAALGKLDSG